MSRSVLAGIFLLSLASCGRYRDFALPPAAGTPRAVSWRWEANPNPVLEPGPGWESSDVLNPSVLLFGGRRLNLYSGFDGKTWHTGLAISRDGTAWAKQGKVLSPDPASWEGDYIAANGSAIASGAELLYYYQAGSPPRIGLAQSSDGRQWRKLGRPVLETGPYGSWDERGVADPYVVRFGSRFYLFYTGMDRARRQRLGVAESADGIVWYKLRGNPVMELGEREAFDGNGLGEPAVWTSDGSYWMLYTGRDRSENRRMGLARSRNGIAWEKQTLVISGDQAWDSKVVCDPTVEMDSGGVRVWFGGGDVASPDERLHGRIGVGMLRAVDSN
ncbi:MAG TPA: hypothetical protein VHD76_16685 [Bryobacteraceae bacterium]|nr:hypothetical protein [Bryobacteraceae bacterium]